MDTIKEKIDLQGRISIMRILGGTNMKPGDFLEVIPDKNKIILKSVQQEKPGEVIESVAGKWKNRSDLVEDILNLRREEDRGVLKID